MENKTRLITPFFMLLAGAIASIIMYVRGFEFTRMLWGLLIVLVVFYILGDIARYLYASIRPRIIPSGNLDKMVSDARKNGDLTGSVVAFADDAQEELAEDADAEADIDEEGYSDEELEEYSTEDTTADMQDDGDYAYEESEG